MYLDIFRKWRILVRVYKGISFNTEKDIARLKKIKEQS